MSRRETIGLETSLLASPYLAESLCVKETDGSYITSPPKTAVDKPGSSNIGRLLDNFKILIIEASDKLDGYTYPRNAGPNDENI